MPPGGRFLNWSNIVFTPDNNGVPGAPISVLGVTNADFDPQAKVISGAGDGDLGPTSINLTDEDPRFTVEFERLSIMRTITPGMRGSLTATHNDNDNGAGTGAMQYVFSNVFVENTPRGGRFRTYGTGRIIFRTWRPDGVTNPVAVSVMP